ncbi:MAG: leucyl/phenylalanyl-tRNA--protein transferase [Planctomycetes bacterium]|nr:leucyl/phenylalanyl-tRNA--protein transferase [Planctomycetota bacterium]
MATSPQSSQAATEQRVVQAVLDAYGQGWFPMAHPDRLDTDGEPEVEWVQPKYRAIIPLDGGFHVPRSLGQRVRSRRFRIASDTVFESVIGACASVPRMDPEGNAGTWLCAEIVETFRLLHRHGHAHSVEAWLDRPGAAPVLVGGLYGVAIGKVFCGESMFHRADLGGTDASKVCLVHLVHHLRARGFQLLDAQLANHHTAQFGMIEMPRAEYLARLAELSRQKVEWLPFTPAC